MKERLMHHETETGLAIVAKVAPPATVSLATLAGYQVSELVMVTTLIYTVLMIVHKAYTFITEMRGKKYDRRVGRPDNRPEKQERRGS